MAYSEYCEPANLDFLRDEQLAIIDAKLAEAILVGIYGHPDQKIMLPESENARTETTVFAIWSQKWPRLRRSFRFCTHTSRDRTTSDHVFDLQFAPASSRYISEYEMSSALRANVDLNSGKGWVEIALADMCGDTKPLQSFLRRAGSDISNGRHRFTVLCRFDNDGQFGDSPPNFEWSLEYVIHDLSSSESRLLRKPVLLDATDNFESLSNRAVELLILHHPVKQSKSSSPTERNAPFKA